MMPVSTGYLHSVASVFFFRSRKLTIFGNVGLKYPGSWQKIIYTNRKLYAIGHHQSSLIKGVKSALRQRGICQDYLAAPFNHFEENEAAIVAEILRETDQLLS